MVQVVAIRRGDVLLSDEVAEQRHHPGVGDDGPARPEHRALGRLDGDRSSPLDDDAADALAREH